MAPPHRYGWARIMMLLAVTAAIAECASYSTVEESRRISDIPVPSGFTRTTPSPASFGSWVADLPLKPGNEILLHTGRVLSAHRYRVLAVVDKPLLFDEDLEQCVDFCLRLWGDYHYERGLLDQLYFFSTNGEKVFFSSWRSLQPASSATDVETLYHDFLKAALSWTNPYSITLGAYPLEPEDLRPGDCIIQTTGRALGQTSLVLDQCTDNGGHDLFLMGFGFSPAQELHIEKAPDECGQGGWFSLKGYFRYLETYYGDFGKPRLFRL